MSSSAHGSLLRPTSGAGVLPASRHRLGLLLAFAAFHVVLGLVMRPFPAIAVTHAVGCVVVGLVIAARRPPHEVAYIVGYIAIAEVLWRMTRTPVFWEFGKYATSAVLLVALARVRLVRNRVTAIGYFVLLLPSALLTLLAFELGEAREQLSFNLSGPLALCLAVLFFSNVRLRPKHVRTTFLVLTGPACGIVTVAYSKLVEITVLEFTANSNPLLSGGFGPNQVSAALGLALLGCVLVLLERKHPLPTRIVLIVFATAFAAQAALTFSRGGLVLSFISCVGAAMYLLRDARARATLLVITTILFVVAALFVAPRLDEFTSGKLAERYTSVDTTGRGMLAGFDLQIFRDNPLLGVGPGAATPIRAELGHFGAAHTEFTRMLAEHGILGAVAIVFLTVLVLRTIRQAKGYQSKAIVVALVSWAMLFLVINAMRLVAPAFTLGIACSVAYASRRTS